MPRIGGKTMDTENLQMLIGLRVREVSVSEDEHALMLALVGFGRDRIIIETEGDCCSETWFADITGLDALRGEVIRDAREDETTEPCDERTRQEHDIAYGFTLTTDRGQCSIAYRNSSNGCYGGWANVLKGSLRRVCGFLGPWRRIVGDEWSA